MQAIATRIVKNEDQVMSTRPTPKMVACGLFSAVCILYKKILVSVVCCSMLRIQEGSEPENKSEQANSMGAVAYFILDVLRIFKMPSSSTQYYT